MEIEVNGIVLIQNNGSRDCWLSDKRRGQRMHTHVDGELTEEQAKDLIEIARIFFEEEERNKKHYWQEYGRQ